MVCPKHPARSVSAEHPVTAALAQLSPQGVTLRLVTEPKEQARWNRLIRQHHYLKEHRLVGESLRYVAEHNGRWIALLGWSSAAFHLRPRDAWIGWTDGQRQARRHLLACNARFLILHAKARHPHRASQLLARNLERLSADWLQHYGHPLLLAETFVDPQRFAGTCYRAANWIPIGLTQGYARSRLDFYQLHAQPKVISLYPLHPKARSLLSAPDLPPRLAPHERTPLPHHLPLEVRSIPQPLAGPQTAARSPPLRRQAPSPGRLHRGHRHHRHDRRQ